MRAPAGAALAALLLAAAGAGASRAQAPDTSVYDTRVRMIHVRESGIVNVAPDWARPDAGDRPAASRFRIEPLPPAEAARLRAAQVLRQGGQLEQARKALAPLLAARPHHAAVVTERLRQLAAAQDWAAAERLGRRERALRRDSLLATQELALALERLGRPRAAAQVALEGWLASPAEAEWARATVLRLAPADLRGVREAARRAAAARPDRPDLALAAALLDWRAGDLKAALAALAAAERPSPRAAPLRWEFAQELAAGESSRDSAAAVEALVATAGDARLAETWRVVAAQRAWEIASQRGAQAQAAPALARALDGVPPARWPGDLVLALARGLRQGGRTDEARALVRSVPGPPAAAGSPLALEEALADLRDGPPERALPRLAALAPSSPEADWRYAEALFFAGRADSALSRYERIAADPAGTWSGAALERAYLIEDGQPSPALAVFGRIAYERWRGDAARALALTDSLAATLPRGSLWAEAQLMLSEGRDAAGDARGALGPLLAIADSLPDDRLAPVARQKAGDVLLRQGDERGALAQYEECLVRYPKAWNAAEVRRAAERLRREKRVP